MAAISTDSLQRPTPGGGTRYFVLRPLASGGMATVELALQVSSGGFERLVALKRVRPHLVSSEEIEAMFLEEARIAARLNHPNLIHAYEVGHDEVGAFLAMEYLSGQTYGHLVSRAQLEELDLRVVVETLIATLDGLECVHAMRDMSGRHMALVHRDISPSNVFLTYTGQVKVLDFGIAKARLSSIQTQVGVLKGKIAYMAPEQASGASLDARADLYAVGVMLWEALAGRRRWADVPEAAILSHLLSGSPPLSPLATQRGLPAVAGAVCLRALAHDPAARFQTAAEFRVALEELLAELGPRLSPRALGEYVSDFFGVERAQAEHLTEHSLRELDRSASRGTGPRPVSAARDLRVADEPDAARSLITARETSSVNKTRELELGTPPLALVSSAALSVAAPSPTRNLRSSALAKRVLGAVAATVVLSAAAWLALHEGASPAAPPPGPPLPAAVPAALRPSQAAPAPAAPAPAAMPIPLSELATEPPLPARAKASPAAARVTVRATPTKKPAPKSSGLALDRRSPW